MAINKIIYGGEPLIDLTEDTVTEDRLVSGYTAHNNKGETITGTAGVSVDGTTLIISEGMVIPNG